MAIQFARVQRVSRSTGGNACCKGAYNSRTKIKDEKTNIVYIVESSFDVMRLDQVGMPAVATLGSPIIANPS